jgi:hypothetical protein
VVGTDGGCGTPVDKPLVGSAVALELDVSKGGTIDEWLEAVEVCSALEKVVVFGCLLVGHVVTLPLDILLLGVLVEFEKVKGGEAAAPLLLTPVSELMWVVSDKIDVGSPATDVLEKDDRPPEAVCDEAVGIPDVVPTGVNDVWGPVAVAPSDDDELDIGKGLDDVWLKLAVPVRLALVIVRFEVVLMLGCVTVSVDLRILDELKIWDSELLETLGKPGVARVDDNPDAEDGLVRAILDESLAVEFKNETWVVLVGPIESVEVRLALRLEVIVVVRPPDPEVEVAPGVNAIDEVDVRLAVDEFDHTDICVDVVEDLVVKPEPVGISLTVCDEWLVEVVIVEFSQCVEELGIPDWEKVPMVDPLVEIALVPEPVVEIVGWSEVLAHVDGWTGDSVKMVLTTGLDCDTENDWPVVEWVGEMLEFDNESCDVNGGISDETLAVEPLGSMLVGDRLSVCPLVAAVEFGHPDGCEVNVPVAPEELVISEALIGSPLCSALEELGLEAEKARDDEDEVDPELMWDFDAVMLEFNHDAELIDDSGRVVCGVLRDEVRPVDPNVLLEGDAIEWLEVDAVWFRVSEEDIAVAEKVDRDWELVCVELALSVIPIENWIEVDGPVGLVLDLVEDMTNGPEVWDNVDGEIWLSDPDEGVLETVALTLQFPVGTEYVMLEVWLDDDVTELTLVLVEPVTESEDVAGPDALDAAERLDDGSPGPGSGSPVHVPVSEDVAEGGPVPLAVTPEPDGVVPDDAVWLTVAEDGSNWDEVYEESDGVKFEDKLVGCGPEIDAEGGPGRPWAELSCSVVIGDGLAPLCDLLDKERDEVVVLVESPDSLSGRVVELEDVALPVGNTPLLLISEEERELVLAPEVSLTSELMLLEPLGVLIAPVDAGSDIPECVSDDEVCGPEETGEVCEELVNEPWPPLVLDVKDDEALELDVRELVVATVDDVVKPVADKEPWLEELPVLVWLVELDVRTVLVLPVAKELSDPRVVELKVLVPLPGKGIPDVEALVALPAEVSSWELDEPRKESVADGDSVGIV